MRLVVVAAALAASAHAFSAPSTATTAITTTHTHTILTPNAIATPRITHAPTMAVPKKRQSKMKTRQRKANWFAKARRQAQLAVSRAKSVNYNPLADPKYSFDAPDDDDDDDDDDDLE